MLISKTLQLQKTMPGSSKKNVMIYRHPISSSFCTMRAFILRSNSDCSTSTAAMQLHARMYRSVSSTRMPLLMFL